MELYIHIPFCERKCAYCDFLSAPADESTKAQYLARLTDEIALRGLEYRGSEVDTLFIGGGTPTVLEGEKIAELMKCLQSFFYIKKDAECTIECNPGTLNQKKAEWLYASGINRISFGLQSTDNRELQLLGRIHTYETFLESYEIARKAGFRNINVDLMSALPGQTPESWENTLHRVLELGPEHISAYSLIIEEGTPFYERYKGDVELLERGDAPKLLPSEDAERHMYEQTEKILSEAGYFRYEISNYARSGYACRHNTGYWKREDYLGLGLGAASLIGDRRFRNTSDLKTYMEQPFRYEEEEKLTRAAQMEEYMFLGLRMMQGISVSDFSETFGVEIREVYGNVIDRLMQQKLLEKETGCLRLTRKGIDVSNYVLSEFLL